MAIQKVGVVGCGLMGSGIAQIAAEAGYATVVREVDERLLGKGKARIEGFLGKSVEKGKTTKEAAAATLARIAWTTKVEDLAPLRDSISHLARVQEAAPACPPDWGAIRIRPESVELWSEAEDRIHERRLFARDGDGWVLTLLSP